MNSPYTKHLDAALDTHATVPVPAYSQVPMHAPMVVHSGSSEGSGAKATIALVAIVLALIGSAGGYMIGKGTGPSWNELRRFEALAGREGEIRGRDVGWSQGRKQGRTEMEFLAKYEQLRTQANAFNQGWNQGLSTGNQMGKASNRYAYYNRYGWGGRNGYGNYGRYGRGGYGSYYGYGGRGSVGNAVAQAQQLANATGSSVDVIVD